MHAAVYLRLGIRLRGEDTPPKRLRSRLGVGEPDEPHCVRRGNGHAPPTSRPGGSKRHPHGCNEYSPDRVRPRSGGLLPGATESHTDRHFLLGPVWDEVPVDRSRNLGVGSAACHVREGRRSPERSLGVKWSSGVGWLGFGPGYRLYLVSAPTTTGRTSTTCM